MQKNRIATEFGIMRCCGVLLSFKSTLVGRKLEFCFFRQVETFLSSWALPRSPTREGSEIKFSRLFSNPFLSFWSYPPDRLLKNLKKGFWIQTMQIYFSDSSKAHFFSRVRMTGKYICRFKHTISDLSSWALPLAQLTKDLKWLEFIGKPL